MMNTKNGWMNEVTIKAWLERILIAYVNGNQCLLLMDSYEAHISESIQTFLKTYPNIHLAIIVGGTTSFLQPLDININRSFKNTCRKHTIVYTNAMLKAINDLGLESEHKKGF